MAELSLDDIRRVVRGHVRARGDAHDATARAAVAAIFRQTSSTVGPEVLLIRRAASERDPWSGHMAFPGGRAQAEDPSLLYTALRETREEVGLSLDAQSEFLGALDDVPAIARGVRTGLTIEPHIFCIESPRDLVLDAREVAEALWVPILPMISGESATTYPYARDGQSFSFPGYRVGEHIVWGLTYGMLSSFFALLRHER